MLGQAAYAAVFVGIAVMAPALQKRSHASTVAVGPLVASVQAGAVLTTVQWGRLADLVGERAVIASLLLGAAGLLAGGALVNGIWWLVLLLVLTGACGAGINAAGRRAVLRWFEPHERGGALVVRHAGTPLG
jgi:MFS family permease